MYIAKLSLFKLIDDWGTDGAACNTRANGFWKGHVSADSIDGIKFAIMDWLNQYGLDFAKFSVFQMDEDPEDMERRFTFCQVEDNDGMPDENGAYLADYDLYVTLAQSIKTPTFDLPVE